MTEILDGKKLSLKILDELKSSVDKMAKKPHLVVVLVGNDPASELYVGLKQKAADKIGIESSLVKYSAAVGECELLSKIKELNADKSVDAILVQMPLPSHISAINVIKAISPLKDADGITPENSGLISLNTKPYAYPCTPKGILLLLDEYKIQIEGKHVVVIGRSNIVGKPLAQMLLNRSATVTVCHSKTENLSEITKTADILISAVGKPHFIKNDMVKNNAIVVDVGTSKLDGKLFGDVELAVKDKSSYFAPVPGGVGPMTIACLMQNAFELSKLN